MLHNSGIADPKGFLLCICLERMEASVATIGYAHVATDGQTLDVQHAALTTAGAEKVFAEKVSGAKNDRRQLQASI
jgi:hypothetical protein